MMKCVLKSTAAALLVMAVIIAVQAVLTLSFSWHVGETFSKTAVSALLICSLLRIFRKSRQAA